MKKALLALTILLAACTAPDRQQIAIVDTPAGSQLTVGGQPFFVKGMNWDYFPIGTNWAYSLWQQPDDVIRAALDNEMPMLQQMGVNVIRQYNAIPPQWVQYIYEQYGIYTMINHSFGRYGMTIGGTDYDHTDYCRDDMRQALLREAEDFARTYKDTPGILLYLLGNENNYGLFWSGAESEDLPTDPSNLPCSGEATDATEAPLNRGDGGSARCLYTLMNEAVRRIKAIDPAHPVAICNGDLQFIDLIAAACPDADVLGINCYRGESFDVLFQDVKEKYGKPLLFTEFGADAYNAVTQQEAPREQAEILLSNWREIYLNAAGMGRTGNCLGGFTFQFSDGWWKTGQTKNLDVHDTHASWANGGYKFDYVKGQNNMNEEWFGICAKGRPDSRGLYPLEPRTAYHVLGKVHAVSPYTATAAAIERHFDDIRQEIMPAK